GLQSISIRGKRGELRRFLGARLCAEHQPQRVGTARNSCFTPTLCAVPARCGWSCGHSRAALVAASPRCAVSQVFNLPLPACEQRSGDYKSAIGSLAPARSVLWTFAPLL